MDPSLSLSELSASLDLSPSNNPADTPFDLYISSSVVYEFFS